VSELNVSICDGKYTVIQEPTGETRVLRYGEEWRDVTGDNVIGGLAWELQESRKRIKRLEEALAEIAYAASHPLGAGQSLTLGKIESIAIKAKEAKS